jgi:hypothetical protein
MVASDGISITRSPGCVGFNRICAQAQPPASGSNETSAKHDFLNRDAILPPTKLSSVSSMTELAKFYVVIMQYKKPQGCKKHSQRCESSSSITFQQAFIFVDADWWLKAIQNLISASALFCYTIQACEWT